MDRQRQQFYTRSMKSWLEKNDIEMCLTHNEGKSVLAERFIRTLKNKIYKYMASISKNMYIDKLDGTVNKYYNTDHITIKMKPVYVKSNSYIDSSKETNDRNPKFKIGDIVRISKYKNIFVKSYTPNWSEEVKNTVPWAYVISNLKGEENVRKFYEKELQETNQKKFTIGKIKRRKKVINYMLNGKDTIIPLIV